MCGVKYVRMHAQYVRSTTVRMNAIFKDTFFTVVRLTECLQPGKLEFGVAIAVVATAVVVAAAFSSPLPVVAVAAVVVAAVAVVVVAAAAVGNVAVAPDLADPWTQVAYETAVA